MLVRYDIAAKGQRDHLITQILVKIRAVELPQHAGNRRRWRGGGMWTTTATHGKSCVAPIIPISG